MPHHDVDPIGLWLSHVGAARRLQACRAQATVRLGVVVNGRAGAGRLGAGVASLHGPWPLHAPHELAGIRRTLATLLAVEGVNVLAIAGGDGTVHQVCNALLALQAEAERLGCGGPLPRLLILRGGTMNILARATGHHVAPARTLRRFHEAFEGAPWATVPARRLSSLLVRGSFGHRHAFVFGSEVVYHAIALYDQFGAGYGGLARFLWELGRGAAVGSALWERERWRLGPFDGAVSIDAVDGASRVFAPFTAAVATTVDLTLATGWVRAIARPELARGFFAKVVTLAEPREIARVVPALMSGREASGVVDVPEACALRTQGPCTLDGELIDDLAGIGRGDLAVLPGPVMHVVPAAIGSDRW